MTHVLLGKAKHKHNDNSVSQLNVIGMSAERMSGWIVIAHDSSQSGPISIHSKKQWEALKKVIDMQF